jgi:Entner-Doudoroff aldolase
MSAEAADRIVAERLLAIVRADSPGRAVEQLAGIAAAGIAVAEVSLSPPNGLGSLRAAVAAHGDRILLGAGTVRGVEQAEAAIGAGARFLVSPGLDLDVHRAAGAAGVTHIPGVLTPTEVEIALSAGVGLLKLFPAGRLGPGYVADLLQPFPAALLVAVGGIGPENAGAFLDAGAVAIGAGGALVGAGGEETSEAIAVRAGRLRRSLLPKTKEPHAS